MNICFMYIMIIFDGINFLEYGIQNMKRAMSVFCMLCLPDFGNYGSLYSSFAR